MMLAILLLIGGMVMMVIFSYRYRLATYFCWITPRWAHWNPSLRASRR